MSPQTAVDEILHGHENHVLDIYLRIWENVYNTAVSKIQNRKRDPC